MSGTADLLSVTEAAEVLGIHPDTAYELIRRDEFPSPVLRIGRRIKVPRKPLERLIDTGTTEMAS